MNLMFTLKVNTLKHINSIFQKNERMIIVLHQNYSVLLFYQFHFNNKLYDVELFIVYAGDTFFMWLVLRILIQDASIFSIIDLTSRKQH